MTENGPNSAKTAPLPLDYLPPPRARHGRLVRELLSRDRMVSRFKTLAWVVPLTGLIWIYAERAQLVLDDVFVPIEIVSTNPNEVVRLQTQSFPDKNVSVKLRGPRGLLEQLHKRLPPNSGPGPMKIEIEPPRPAGPHALPTAQLLRSLPAFQGVEIESAQPMSLHVVVDTVEDRLADVAIPPEITNLEPATSFDVQQVKVRGPKEVLSHWAEQFPGAAMPKVYADLARLPALKVPGEHEVEVPFIVPLADEGVKVIPERVKVTLHVRAADVNLTIPSLPISTEIPPAMLNKIYVVWSGPPAVPNVKVVGSAEQIKALESGGAVGCKAILELDASMQEGEKYERTVQIRLPEGVRLASRPDECKVEFQLKALPE